MIIRKAKVKDLDAIHDFGKKEKYFQVSEGVSGFWKKPQLKKWIKSKSDVFLVAEEEKIVGFAMATLHKPTGKATFENLWVNPKLRKRGIAINLFKGIMQELKKKGAIYVFAMAEINNKSILRLLKKMKFNKGDKHYWMGKEI
jgi:N-acetylglutamate synthase-like GNAT family acetyltransferase